MDEDIIFPHEMTEEVIPEREIRARMQGLEWRDKRFKQVLQKMEEGAV